MRIVVVMILVLGIVGSTLSVYPDQLSYFNVLAGGPEGGHRYLVHSSTGWGQDVLSLREWLESHPDARPVGAEVPAMWELADAELPVTKVTNSEFRETPLRWYVVDTTVLQRFGLLTPVHGEDFSEDELGQILHASEFIDRVGASFFVFRYAKANPPQNSEH